METAGTGCTPTSFEELYEIFSGLIRESITRIVRKPGDIEDVLQEVFIRAWKQRENWSEIRNLRNWLTRIAINLSLNHLRGRNRKRELLIGDTQPEANEDYALRRALTDLVTPGPESQLIRNNRRDIVRHAIADLPVEKREVLELVDQEDFSIRETSEQLEIPYGTVKSRLHYGRKIVSERIRDLLDD